MHYATSVLFCEEKNFIYPAKRNVAAASMAPARRTAKAGVFAPVDPSEYESNMTVLAVMKENDEILGNVQEIAVFDGTRCLATAMPEADGFFYLTIPGDRTVTNRLAIVAVVDGNVVESSTSLYFSEDATYGDFDAPFVVTLGNTTMIDDIMLDENYCRMQVIDLSGRLFYSGSTAGYNENDLEDGQYIFEFFTTEGQVVCYKKYIRRIEE